MRQRLQPILTVLILAVLLYFPVSGWRHFATEVKGNPEEPYRYGTLHDMPGFAWVKLVNADGVRTADLHLRQRDTCLLQYRGEVQEIENFSSFRTWYSGEILVEYSPPVDRIARGVLCPDGTRFFATRAWLDSLQPRFEARFAHENELRRQVRALTSSAEPGRELLVQDYFTWVESVTPAKLSAFGYEIRFLETCGIEAGGTVRRLGNSLEGTVYRYEPNPTTGFRGVGIPCPAGTLILGPENPATL